jgi:hypothetical protein
MTWRDEAAEIIREGTKHLPDDMPLKERKAVVADLCPSWWRQMSWPQKAWQAARREYLVRYGYKPRTKHPDEKEAAALPLFGGDA